MNTNTQTFISKININSLSNLKSISRNKINQETDDDKKLIINVEFDGYHDAVSEIKTLVNVIEVLSLNACVSDKESLELISSVSKIVQKIIPDLIFLDSLLFDDLGSTRQNFKTVEELI